MLEINMHRVIQFVNQFSRTVHVPGVSSNSAVDHVVYCHNCNQLQRNISRTRPYVENFSFRDVTVEQHVDL